MPLFESQSSRNERLFGAVQDAAFKTMHEQFGDDPEASTHSSWVAGGMHLAQSAVDHLETLKNAWGKGSVESARSLTVLFALSMISRWYRATRADRSVKDETRAVQIAATNILTLLGQEALADIVDFVNLHSQFIYECDWVEGKTPASGLRVEVEQGSQVQIAPPTGATEAPWGDVFQNPLSYNLSRDQLDYVGKHLFKPQVEAFIMLGVKPTKERLGVISWGYHLAMDKALVASGEVAAIDWRVQTFPVEKYDDLRWLPGRHLPNTVTADFGKWLLLVVSAQEMMFKVYRALKEGAST